MKYMKILILLLVLGTTAACSDDEEKIDERIVTEDGKTGVPDSLLTDQERYQLACQFAVINTLRTLTGLERIDGDLTNTNHEPTYGETLDGEGSTVRAVKCESTTEAEQSFRAIASLDSADAVRLLTPTADGYVLSLKDLPILENGKKFTLGTLTFHRDGGPRRYGWVDVDIPCIPHLERIDYLSPDAFPDNAGGNCPYQVGDVVWVPNYSNYVYGYYVCIATNGYHSTLAQVYETPRFDSSCGINLDDDNEGAWKPKNSGEKSPTTFSHIKDFVTFMMDNKGMVANIKAFLNGKANNKKPSYAGRLNHIFPRGFNNDKGVVYSGSRAYILYDCGWGAYYWIHGWIASGWNYRIQYYAGILDGCTSRDQVYSTYYKYVYDSDWNNDWSGCAMFTMNIIDTDVLVSGATLDYSALNDKLELGVRAENATKNDLGKCYADDGILYESRKQAQEYGHTPLGIVVYVNYGTEWGKEVTESDHNGGHGLVMAYKEKSKSSYSLWETPNEPYSEDNYYSGYLGSYFIDARNDINGYDKTQALEFAGVEAAGRALNDWPEAPSESSGWFIPTTGQWLAALNYGLGNSAAPYDYDLWTGSLPGSPVKTINNYTNRDNATTLGGHYWTSSAQGASASKGVFIYTNSSYTATFKSASSLSSDNNVYLRPFLAF